jgi:hypothetical protein
MSVLEQEQESIKDIREDTLESSTTHTTSRRLTDIEVQRRVDKCFDLRYNADKPILQREWVDLCKKEYGDKSIPMYTQYWVKAKSDYDEQWRAGLEGMLKPAMVELQSLLLSDNPMIKQKAIDQIVKYTGNDVQKHLVAIQDISIGFGED